MVSANYRRYLKSERWARKRQQVFNHYGKRCYVCKTSRPPIQVHHLTYIHFGNEKMNELRPLCYRHHREVTRLHWKLGKRKSGFEVFAKFVALYNLGKIR